MPLFTVTMTHPDGPEWGRHVLAHVEYLLDLIERGTLKASGPLKGLPLRAGFLVMAAADRDEIGTLIAADPFATEGLIAELTVCEWDPLFGALADESSKMLPNSLVTVAARLGYDVSTA